jgi:hypothetical protein
MEGRISALNAVKMSKKSRIRRASQLQEISCSGGIMTRHCHKEGTVSLPRTGSFARIAMLRFTRNRRSSSWKGPMTNSAQRNLVVEVRFEIEKDSDGYPKSRDAEVLQCKPLNVDCSLCTVENVPFYLRNVAYGDTVSTADHPSGYLEFAAIVKRGGYSVYRIILHESSREEDLIRRLLNFGVLLERDGRLIAIAVPPKANLDAVVDYLLEGKAQGHWGLQDGYIFEN